jgi:hypothetical protein
LRGLACDGAEPVNCPPLQVALWALLGGKIPRDNVHGRYSSKRTGSHPVRLFYARRAALGAEVPPQDNPGYYTVRPGTLPVHGAREDVASFWLRLVRSRCAGTASGAHKPSGFSRGVPDSSYPSCIVYARMPVCVSSTWNDWWYWHRWQYWRDWRLPHRFTGWYAGQRHE